MIKSMLIVCKCSVKYPQSTREWVEMDELGISWKNFGKIRRTGILWGRLREKS